MVLWRGPASEDNAQKHQEETRRPPVVRAWSGNVALPLKSFRVARCTWCRPALRKAGRERRLKVAEGGPWNQAVPGPDAALPPAWTEHVPLVRKGERAHHGCEVAAQ